VVLTVSHRFLTVGVALRWAQDASSCQLKLALIPMIGGLLRSTSACHAVILTAASRIARAAI
jgi:hypothetical protein